MIHEMNIYIQVFLFTHEGKGARLQINYPLIQLIIYVHDLFHSQVKHNLPLNIT